MSGLIGVTGVVGACGTPAGAATVGAGGVTIVPEPEEAPAPAELATAVVLTVAPALLAPVVAPLEEAAAIFAACPGATEDAPMAEPFDADAAISVP